MIRIVIKGVSSKGEAEISRRKNLIRDRIMRVVKDCTYTELFDVRLFSFAAGEDEFEIKLEDVKPPCAK